MIEFRCCAWVRRWCWALVMVIILAAAWILWTASRQTLPPQMKIEAVLAAPPASFPSPPDLAAAHVGIEQIEAGLASQGYSIVRGDPGHRIYFSTTCGELNPVFIITGDDGSPRMHIEYDLDGQGPQPRRREAKLIEAISGVNPEDLDKSPPSSAETRDLVSAVGITRRWRVVSGRFTVTREHWATIPKPRASDDHRRLDHVNVFVTWR